MAESKVSTYVTGFCGVKNHARCPMVIHAEVGGRSWVCMCKCHEGQEPPPIDFGVVSTESISNFSISIPVEAANPEAWALIFGCNPDVMRVVWGLREVLTKMDLET